MALCSFCIEFFLMTMRVEGSEHSAGGERWLYKGFTRA
jgi:hypothetical protein